jgi:hypothetical protein
MPCISSKEDSSEPSCVLALALVLLHSLSGTALFPLLAPSLSCPIGSCSQTQPGPPSPTPPRSPLDCPACRLSCTLSSVVKPAPASVRPWHEVKSPRGAPKRVNTEGFACPNPKCPYSGITDAHLHASCCGWQAWPCRADPDVSRPCLPHHVQCSTPHSLAPFENPLSPDRNGADGASLWAGPFLCRACLWLPTSHMARHRPLHEASFRAPSGSSHAKRSAESHSLPATNLGPWLSSALHQ